MRITQTGNHKGFGCAAFAALLFCSACVVTGDVVTVTTAEQGTYAGLKEEDQAKLDEIRRAKGDRGLADNLKSVIQETTHYTVDQYLQAYPKAKDSQAGDYEVGGYDVLNITVYEEEDLSRDAVRVSGDGYISFPLIGRVRVSGLTTSEIEKLISDKLAQGQYLLDAHVSVMVTEYNSKNFLVLGAVKAPGSYPLRARERILDAISKVEGINFEQASKKGMLIRTLDPNTTREQKVVISIDLYRLLKGRDQISNLFIADKDTLYIPTAEHFYIIGQVQAPGSYVIPDEDFTLVEAISLAGGFTTIAARNRTRIIRLENDEEKIIQVRVDAITKAGKKVHDVIIQPDDVIVVPESFF
jgi:polysaccharide export outer membrane protein